MRTFIQDLRFAARVLWRKPGFTVIVALTLALGIGAGSSMFSILYSVLLHPLDLPDVDRLVAVQEKSPRYTQFENDVSPRGFFEYRDENHAFEQLAAYQWWDVSLTGASADPERVVAFQVSPGYFPMLGVQPLLGRWFADDEVDGKNERVAILGQALWERRYGADRGIIGRPITIDGRSYTVVGVMPRRFRVPNAGQLWAPLTLTAEQRAD